MIFYLEKIKGGKMRDENSVLLTGRLTKDPELSYMTNQNAICKFNLANNQDDKTAFFFPCVAYEKAAEFIKGNFSKGDPVYLRGLIKQRSWNDSTSGRKITQTFIQVQRLNKLSIFKKSEE